MRRNTCIMVMAMQCVCQYYWWNAYLLIYDRNLPMVRPTVFLVFNFDGGFINDHLYKMTHQLSWYQSQFHGFDTLAPCLIRTVAWWRHQMETFSALLAICAGNSPVTSEFPAQKLVTRSFDVFFDLHPNKWLKTIVRLVIWDAIMPIMTSL